MPQGQERVRHGAGLLLQFPQRAGHRVLARIQLAGGDLQHGPAEHIAVLGHGQNVVALVQRQHGHAVHMLHHFPACGGPVRQADRVCVDGEEGAAVLFFPAEGLLSQICKLIHNRYTSYTLLSHRAGWTKAPLPPQKHCAPVDSIISIISRRPRLANRFFLLKKRRMCAILSARKNFGLESPGKR